MNTDAGDRITLTLSGEHAQEGISLDAFDGFITHFTNALRYHYRAAKAEPTRRTGHPLSREQLATSFRLVGFHVGSAVVVLDPPLTERTPGGLLESDVPTLAWMNVDDLLAKAGAGAYLDDDVASELDAAAKCLGSDGSFEVDFRSGGQSRNYTFDSERLTALRPPQEPVGLRPCTITGHLHAIDLEPGHVAIRAASGVDWRCTYPDDMEQHVLTLVGMRVWARGEGRMISARAGALEVAEIHAVAVYEQTAMFTSEPTPFAELMTRQSVSGPQGLTAVSDPEWEPDEESERFLEAIFAESD